MGEEGGKVASLEEAWTRADNEAVGREGQAFSVLRGSVRRAGQCQNCRSPYEQRQGDDSGSCRQNSNCANGQRPHVMEIGTLCSLFEST